MEKYISKDALVAEIEKIRKTLNLNLRHDQGVCDGLYAIQKYINTLEVKECETKSGIVQKDLQIVLDDGTYIDLDPSMQLKPSFSVKGGEKVKVVIIKDCDEIGHKKGNYAVSN